MRSKLLTNHEIEYFAEKAAKPPEDIRDLVSDQFTFWHLESQKLTYDWTLKASPSFEKVWIDFHITGVTKATSNSLDRKLLISKSKPKYTYER